mmetsp:Transcript_15079/g.32634  ORF Transcript_15079/g.32634 Transcript_15079/m.32634 type:complete len:344 (-) Transcript_15079:401-1432(-)
MTANDSLKTQNTVESAKVEHPGVCSTSHGLNLHRSRDKTLLHFHVEHMIQVAAVVTLDNCGSNVHVLHLSHVQSGENTTSGTLDSQDGGELHLAVGPCLYPPCNLLNGNRRLSKLLCPQGLDTIKGFTTKEYLRTTKLQTGNSTSGREVQREELFSSLGTSNSVGVVGFSLTEFLRLGLLLTLILGSEGSAYGNKIHVAVHVTGTRRVLRLLDGSVALLSQRHHHCLVISLPDFKRNPANQLLNLQIILTHAKPLLVAIWTDRQLVSKISQDVIPRLEYIVRITSRISSTTDAYSLEYTTATKLIHYHFGVKTVGNQLVVWFETTNVVGNGGIDTRAKLTELC